MFLNIYKKDAVVYLELGGKILLEQCDSVKDAVLPLLTNDSEELIINLHKVSYMDSAGLGMLVGFKMTSNKCKINFSLHSPSKEIFEILEISKLTEIFPIKQGYEAEMIAVSLARPPLLVKEIKDDDHGFADTISDEDRVRIVSPSIDESSDEKVSDSDTPGGEKEPGADNIEKCCKQALELLHKGEFANSIEKYKQALKIDPDHVTALNNLAVVYEKRDIWHSDAIKTWEKILRLCAKQGDDIHVERAKKHLAKLRRS